MCVLSELRLLRSRMNRQMCVGAVGQVINLTGFQSGRDLLIYLDMELDPRPWFLHWLTQRSVGQFHAFIIKILLPPFIGPASLISRKGDSLHGSAQISVFSKSPSLFLAIPVDLKVACKTLCPFQNLRGLRILPGSLQNQSTFLYNLLKSGTQLNLNWESIQQIQWLKESFDISGADHSTMEVYKTEAFLCITFHSVTLVRHFVGQSCLDPYIKK